MKSHQPSSTQTGRWSEPTACRSTHRRCSDLASDALVKFDREKFDMVVTDYRMEEMNGLELARLLRCKAPDIPVFIVSGFPPTEGSDEVTGWIQKEEMFPILLDKVKHYLGEGVQDASSGRETLKRA